MQIFKKRSKEVFRKVTQGTVVALITLIVSGCSLIPDLPGPIGIPGI